MTTPELPEQQLLREAAFISTLEGIISDARARMRATLAKMPRGTKLTAFDPDERSLGTISMSDPDMIAVASESDVFETWLRQTYAEHLETWLEFGDPAEVGAVLAEHAPHLIIEHTTMPHHIREKALARAVHEDIPGTKRVQPAGRVTVRPSKHARALAAKALTDAGINLPELGA